MMPALIIGAVYGFLLAAIVSALLMVLAMPVGIGWLFVIACSVLSGRSRWTPELATPSRVAAGTAGLPRLGRNHPHGRDWAWPAYPAVQWRYDWLAACTAVRSVINGGYQRLRSNGPSAQEGRLARLLRMIPYAGWTGVAIGMLYGACVATVVFGLVLAAIAAGWLAVLGVLRCYDGLVRRLRKTAVICPHPECYYEQRVPDYRCSSCRAVHRDIRPGLLGALWRRCGCAARIPTTVLRAAHALTAQCKRCGQPLRSGSAAMTAVSLPVFGPVSAGKTHLVRAGLVRLREELIAVGAELGFDDAASQRVFEESCQLIADAGNTTKTPAGQLPGAVTARVHNGRRGALVNFFDAAGEFFVDHEHNTELEFLDHAGGLVFVVDPFSIPSVQDQLGGNRDERVLAAQPASGTPEDIYQLTTQRLRDHRVGLNQRALAIVVVKADLLPDRPWAAPLLDGAVREWLFQTGQDNLVLAAERDFVETEYFIASSRTGVDRDSPLSPAAPFLWLMHRGGVPVAQAKPRSKETA